MLTRFSTEARMGLDDEVGARRTKAGRKRVELFGREDDSEMRDRDVVSVDCIAPCVTASSVDEVSDDLVTEKIEVDPALAAAAFGTTEKSAIQGARGIEVVDRKGKMEGLQ